MQGTRLGPYEILRQLGAGGMGEVWLAEDSRLGRKVAIKILPAEFAQDRERLARFEQEARAAAALNHPHIAAVFDVGVHDGTHFMVQEYLQGHSMRTLLQGGAMEPERARSLAVEIAEALKAAHGAGIVHRDLKPENVFVTPDGHAKVLDFGLAKLGEHAAPSRGLSQSPTSLGTAAGMVMGTAGYMAPEQARGEAVDARADIFAFGCVLYEMLAGRRAFDGTDVIQVLNQVLREQPQALAQAAPASGTDLQRLVDKCLRKRADERYQGAADLLVDLRTAALEPSDESPQPLATAAARPASRRSPALLGVVAVLALTAGYAAARLLGAAAGPEAPVVADLRLPLALPIDLEFSPPPLTLSPDGRTVVFEGVDNGAVQLYRMDLVGGAPVPIPGTEDGSAPAFSPDGRWIFFGSARSAAVMKVSLSGGSPTLLLPIAGYMTGAVWSRDDTILFSSNSAGLRRVRAAGDEVQTLTDVDEVEGVHSGAWLLPGETHVLFSTGRVPDAEVEVLELATGQRIALDIAGVSPFYVEGPEGRGYVVCLQESSLVAVPFDAERLQVTGVPVRVLDPVGATPDNDVSVAMAAYAAGALLYLPPNQEAPTRSVWIDRHGETRAEMAGAEKVDELDMDRTGSRIAMVSRGFNAILMIDRATGASWRLAAERPSYATLSPDGALLAYTDELVLHLRAADGSDAPRELLPGEKTVSVPHSWSPDGATIYFYKVDPQGLRDIWTYRLADGVAAPLLATERDERAPTAAPAGGWLAYVSDAGGRLDVYVIDVEASRPPRQISRAGGGAPAWSAAGDELYFRSDDGWFMAASFDPDTGLAGEPVRLFEDRFLREQFRNANYAVAPDGSFLLPERLPGTEVREARLFVGFADWVDEQVRARQ